MIEFKNKLILYSRDLKLIMYANQIKIIGVRYVERVSNGVFMARIRLKNLSIYFTLTWTRSLKLYQAQNKNTGTILQKYRIC